MLVMTQGKFSEPCGLESGVGKHYFTGHAEQAALRCKCLCFQQGTMAVQSDDVRRT